MHEGRKQTNTWSAYAGSRLELSDALGRRRPKRHPSSRTGENPPYGMIGGIEETSASFEARSAPRSYPTAGAPSNGRPYRNRPERLGFHRYGGDRLSTQACHRAVASLGKPIKMLGGHSTGRRSPANPAASARAALSAMRTHRGAGSSNPSPSRGGVREPSVPARCRSTDSSKPLAPPWRGHPAPWPVGRRSRLQGPTEKYRNRRSTTGTWST
jgi:hypothetical protein